MKLLTVIVLAVALAGCGPNDETLQTWQDATDQLESEIVIYQQELAGVTDPVERAVLETRVAKMQEQVATFSKALSTAEGAGDIPWAIGETIIGAIAAVVPAVGIALPIIRTLRKQRASIFAAVEAGGGVNDKGAAKTVLLENPAAVAALSAWKAAKAA